MFCLCSVTEWAFIEVFSKITTNSLLRTSLATFLNIKPIYVRFCVTEESHYHTDVSLYL
jgi:hypothetical protein